MTDLRNNAISPLDGRYFALVEELQNYFSEFALFKKRLFVEINYLLFLSSEKIISNKLNTHEQLLLSTIHQKFNYSDYDKIKSYEKLTRHDVKALEYFLRDKLAGIALGGLINFVHFGLTSEDVNNLAYGLLIKKFLENEYYLCLKNISSKLLSLAKEYKDLKMMARTHGQPAVPTTFGKELAVFVYRLQKLQEKIKNLKIEGKFNGAVGNYNALFFVYPKIDWIGKSQKFIGTLGLEPNIITTQIESNDSLALIFSHLNVVNSVLINLCQDLWLYNLLSYISSQKEKKEVGSSTMPQKINPVDFENAEGNLLLANSFFGLFLRKFPVSRLQRDLSDSTVKRNIGVAFGHTILAMKSILNGLGKIIVNKERIQQDLESDYAVLGEAVQLLLKTHGEKRSYELVKDLTRGKKLTKKEYLKMVGKLTVADEIKNKLAKVTPLEYTGLAAKLVDYLT